MKKTKLNYLVADVTEPVGTERRVIIHVCNDQNVMGAGVAKAIADKWPSVKARYHAFMRGAGFLGDTQFVKVEDGICVANMIAQAGLKSGSNPKPLKDDSLHSCLNAVRDVAKSHGASVHVPFKMGCGLANGSWETVEKLLVSELCEHGVSVIVYDKFSHRPPYSK